MVNKYYQIERSGKEAEILIFGELTADPWIESDVSAHGLVSELQNLDADTVHVHIDSYGGDVSEGWAIYNALKNHPAHKITHADGFVASAALYPFLAGDERIANNVSAFFLHRVMTGVFGNADELRKAADEAEKLNEIGLGAFENAGCDTVAIRAMMESETWLSGADALEHGIATQLVKRGDNGRQTQSARQIVLRQLFTPKPVMEQAAKPEIKEEKQEIKPVFNLRQFVLDALK